MNAASLLDMSCYLTERFLVLLAQSSIVLLLGLGLGMALRRHGPFAQSATHRSTLAAVVCTGLFSAASTSHVHPLWRISLPTTPPRAAASSSELLVPSGSGNVPIEKIMLPRADTSLPVSPSTLPLPRPAVLSPSSAAQPPFSGGGRLYIGVVTLWCTGSIGMLTWLGLGQHALRRLRRSSILVESGEAYDLLTALLPHAPPALRASPHVHSPFLAGIREPTVYLPASYAQDFGTEEMRAILTHEAAHHERRDGIWMLALRLTCVLLWPQPLLWLLSRRMEQSAEEACDALVLTHGCAPRTYADCLLSLAERLNPSRTERSLGLGVVPFQSQVGRRIQQILGGMRHPRRISRGLRLGIAAVIFAAVATGLLVVSANRQSGAQASADTGGGARAWTPPTGYLAQFAGARPLGGAEPIQILSIFDKTILYPNVLTADEKSLLRQCQKCAVYYTDYASGGPSLHDQRVLQGILTQRPRFFFAEYLMGVWHKKNHDLPSAEAWMEHARQDAPAIIAGRVQFADGSPVSGYTFRPSVSLYSSAYFMESHGEYNDPQNLHYPEVTTDAHGCYFLPVFRGIYETPSWSATSLSQQSATAHRAMKMDVMSPQTGEGGLRRFTFTGRVGILPPMIARPYLEIGPPFRVGNKDRDKTLRVSGSDLAVTWPAYPGASKYEASLVEVVRSYRKESYNNINFWADDPHFHQAVPTTTLRLPLSGNQPALLRTRFYQLTITARSAGGDQLSDSHPYYFQPLSGIGPQSETKAGLMKLLPPGFVIDMVTRTPLGGVVTGTKPSSANLDILTQRDLFGWQSVTSDTHPVYIHGQYAQRDRFRLTYTAQRK